MSIATSLAVRRSAVEIALRRYGTAYNADDMVANALLALVEADHRFRPYQNQTKTGYPVRYALGQVAGILRGLAQADKDTSDTQISASDLGIEELFFEGKSELFNDSRLWVVDGKVTPEWKIIEDHPEAADILQELADEVEGEFENIEPAWIIEPQQDDTVKWHIIDALPDPTDGVQAVLWLVVASAMYKPSAARITWSEEELDQMEKPWLDLRNDQGSASRPVVQMARDRAAWSQNVIDYWRDTRLGWTFIADPEPVLAYLAGDDTVIDDPAVLATIQALESLSEAIWDSDEDSVEMVGRSVARTLAERIVTDGLTAKGNGVSMVEKLRQAFLDYFGMEPDEWEPTPLPHHEVLRSQIEPWLNDLDAWPSQKAGIRALLNGASPWEARKVEQSYF